MKIAFWFILYTINDMKIAFFSSQNHNAIFKNVT
jgi:hypothetical protein